MRSLRFERGFTLIELLVVMVIVALLLSIAAPRYFHSLQKSKEAVLRQDLHALREAIDKHYGDTGRYPSHLEDLASKKYVRSLPVDPITESADTWIAIPPEDKTLGAVYNVTSGAPGQALDGTPYSIW